MTVEEFVVAKRRSLPPDRQREVLACVEFLAERNRDVKRPRRSAEGLWSNLGVALTEDDIPEARREMWGSFPREFPTTGE
jgi:hypothetical protein